MLWPLTVSDTDCQSIQLKIMWQRDTFFALHDIETAMAGAALKPKRQELYDRINALTQSRIETGKVDEWAWRTLKREIESLGKVPEFAGDALLLLGIIWGIAFNAEEMDRCFNIYAGKYGKDWLWHRARAHQSSSFGRVDSVMEMLKYGYPEGDLPNIYFVARICNQAGLFQTAAKTLDRALALGGALPEEEVRMYTHLPDILSYMDANDVDEYELARRIELAARVVLKMAGPLTTFEAHGSEAGITFEYNVDADIERLVDIDFAISEELSAAFEDTYSRHISIGVVPPARSH